MKSLLSKDEKTKLLEALRRQGIIIRKAGIEIEMPSFDASSLKEIRFTLFRKNSFPGTLKLRRSSLALESALSAMHSFLKQNCRKLRLLLMPAAVPV